MNKDFDQRLEDLRSHASLLRAACERFNSELNFDEVRNVGVRLRVIVGSQGDDGLLFDLAGETGDVFRVMKLNQYGLIRITESDPITGKVVQSAEKKALIPQAFGRLPIIFSDKPDSSIYSSIELKDWVENGFLLDWEVPQGGQTPKIKTFSPQFLIERYAGQEGAHASPTHGVFGTSIESVTVEYVRNGQKVNVPIVYDFLIQIGFAVASIALVYVEKSKTRMSKN